MKNRFQPIATLFVLSLALYGCSSSDSPSITDSEATAMDESSPVESPTQPPATDPNDTRILEGIWQNAATSVDTFLVISADGRAITWTYRGNLGPNCYTAEPSTLMNVGIDQYLFSNDSGDSGVFFIRVEGVVLTITTPDSTTEWFRRDDLDPNFLECPPGT